MFHRNSITTRSDTAENFSPRAQATNKLAPGKRQCWLQRLRGRLLAAMLVASFGWASAMAQGQSQDEKESQVCSITGVVMDPSGAVVPNASVRLRSVGDPDAVVSSTASGEMGGYRLRASAGIYVVLVEAEGFAKFESDPIEIGVTLGSGASFATVRTLDIVLKLETRVDKIEVPSDLAGGNSTGTTLVLSKRDVEQMPLDSTALLEELQGLAGGPNAQLYVGGFSSAKLPPRGSIGQIRIKQNAYSAENDTDPGNGVIQVSTQPGTDQLHGELYVYGDDSALNARNPFAPDQAGYYADGAGGSVSGSVSPRASFFAGWDQLRMEMNSAIDAQTLDANLNPTQASYAVPAPRSSLIGSSRLDLRTNSDSTLMVRYALDRERQTNGGIAGLALPSQGFASSTVTQTLQVANTQVIGTKIVNETRFQYIRTRAEQTPVSTDPTIVVEGAFLGGGNNLGAFRDHLDRYELQNYLSLAQGHHYIEVGGRLRVGRDANESRANFQGEFIFSSLAAYQATKQMMAQHNIADIRAAGGGASQFSMSAGKPATSVTVADAGVFVQDEWKLRPTLTLSYGLRFETQSYIADHADWAPRAGLSWAFGKAGPKSPPNYVLRVGAGVFYRRFASASALQVERQNGFTQQEYVVASPQFCPGGPTLTTPACSGIPGIAELAAQSGASTVYRVNSSFHAAYYIGESVGLERRLGRFGSTSATYTNSRGVHTQVTENVNAPLPGTYDPTIAASGVRPNGISQNIYEFNSQGASRSSALTTSLSLRANRFGVFGHYMLSSNTSDAESDGSFPSDPYNLGRDNGRSQNDVRHTVAVGDNASLPYGIVTWAYLTATSGAPFNIVVSQDLNGDSQFNDRPAFATDRTRASVVATKWGTFDTSPIAGQTIVPRNYAQGPTQFLLNLAVGKTFGVGPKVKPADGAAKGPAVRKYAVEFWAESQNLLNHPNLTSPVGTLGSTLFGQSLGLTSSSSLSPDRLIDLQLSMHF